MKGARPQPNEDKGISTEEDDNERYIHSYDVIMSEEDAKIYDEFQAKRWKDTIEYEKKRGRNNMKAVKPQVVEESRSFSPIADDLDSPERYLHCNNFYIDDEEEAKLFYDLQVKQYEDTIRYEQRQQKRKK